MAGFSVSRYVPEERSVWGRLTARDSVVRRLDWPLLGSSVALSFIDALLVWSATRGRDSLTHGDPYFFLFRHALNTGIGLALMIGTIWLGHRTLRGAVPVLYGLSVLLVLAVLTPLGATVNGAHAWILLPGGFSLQPSEFTKITIILGMAMLLAARVDAGDQLHPDHRTVAKALGLALVPMAVVMLMPDLGSVMVMAVIVLGVLIGSGGLTGTGLFNGSQTTGQFVPEQQTDFVFTVAGEELGFLGAGLIIVLLGVVLWRACRIARGTTELYGTIVAAGIIAWFAFQSFENIGMTLGIMPVAGLPLPFVSYAGSSMFAVWVAIRLLPSIQVQRP